jgi:hypothetical protein
MPYFEIGETLINDSIIRCTDKINNSIIRCADIFNERQTKTTIAMSLSMAFMFSVTYYFFHQDVLSIKRYINQNKQKRVKKLDASTMTEDINSKLIESDAVQTQSDDEQKTSNEVDVHHTDNDLIEFIQLPTREMSATSLFSKFGLRGYSK